MSIDEPTPPIPETDAAEAPSLSEEQVGQVHGCWQHWKAHPTPQALADTLHAVRPALDRAVARYPGQNKTIVGAEAKRLAIGAIKTYDPAQGTSLSTHLFNHLRPLGRQLDNLGRGVSQSRLDRQRAAGFLAAQNDLRETHGREPSDGELQDHLGVSARELTKHRLAARGEVAEGQADHLGAATDDQEDEGRLGMWTDFVYHDLPGRDQKIVDMSMGRNGHKVCDTNEIAAHLGLSVQYVNRQRKEVAHRILEGVNSMDQPEGDDEAGETSDHEEGF